MFVHLHCHSYYSFLMGTSSVASLVKEAAQNGIRHLALTDIGGVYGAVEFSRLCRAHGIHPIIGAEIPISNTYITVLCKNHSGYEALCRSLTCIYLKPDHSPLSLVPYILENNWVLVRDATLLETIAQNYSSSNLVAEIVDHGTTLQKRQNKLLLESANRFHVMSTVTNNVFFTKPQEYKVHCLLSAIRLKTTVGKLRPSDTVSPEAWLKPPRLMRQLFTSTPQLISNTMKIATSCEFSLPIGARLHPPYPLPKGETHYSLLWKKAFNGASLRFHPLRPAHIHQLEHELTVINKMGYAEYFLTVADIVDFAKRNRIPTVGRGSAAGSLTAYALGITNVDPFKYGLYFERFLNPERSDPPDIDIDFCWRRRKKVIQYLYDKYGKENTAMLSTFVTMAGRMALRETARAMGLPEEEISRFTHHIPHHNAVHIDTVLREIPECANIPSRQEPYRSIIAMGKQIAGLPRHIGQHPCGIVLSSVPLSKVVPLQMSTSGLAVTQFDMRSAENMGLLKIDILGQRSLSVIADTIELVNSNHNTTLSPRNIPPDDVPTWHTLQRGATMGCFQVESPGMRGLLKKLSPNDMETVVAASSVIRPGPADAGMLREFIERYHHRKPITYLHPILKKLLNRTLGIMVYQEDILRVAHAVAGFSLGEADKLRRAMSSKRSAEAMHAMKDTFIEGAMAHGIDKETALKIWSRMKTFSGYAFCKAHSASYAILSWQAAYLKTHFPAEFFAALLSNGGGFYTPAAYVLEARRWGINVLPPHINRSSYFFTPEGKSVRTGFCAVSGLSEKSARRIISERRKRLFTSFSDVVRRSETSKEVLEKLIKCGAMDCFEFSRPELLWKLELSVKQPPGKPLSNKRLPYGEEHHNEISSTIIPRPGDYALEEKLHAEWEILKMYLSAHPLTLYGKYLKAIPRIMASSLPQRKGKYVRLAGWLVASRRVFAKNKRYMKFLTLDDESSTFEVVLFPDTYSKWGSLTSTTQAFIIEGKVCQEFSHFTVEACKVIPIEKYQSSMKSIKF